MIPLTFYNSLTRDLGPFAGPRDGETVRLYTCGPTVYNYQHIGNMRAFLFADTLGRTLRWAGYRTKHVINITDVGHLISDADAGDDKMERAAAERRQSIWAIAAHYTDAFKRDVRRLNIVEPAAWTVATDHIPQMIDFARGIEKSCYRLGGGLYFDTSSVPHYGLLARARADEGESRIEPVDGKRHPQDFAIWRTTPPGERRQMEWDSPWGRGAPGWHLECSVMSLQHLGHPFDIHTGGIDHREIHHPNEIAQNQAHCACFDTGADWWMHNNFLVDRRGKMSKSSGDFLTLQALVDRGFHPLAYRLMCLQAHYRSEMEFIWEGLASAAVRLKRLVLGVRRIARDTTGKVRAESNTSVDAAVQAFARAIGDDLNTPAALTELEKLIKYYAQGTLPADQCLDAVLLMDEALGLDLETLDSERLRIRPPTATITEAEIDRIIGQRRTARAEKDFVTSDRLRDQLAATGVEVMDGDPLGWDWKLSV